MVLELYSARKEAKEYLEFYASPNEKGKLEEYKSIICEEFYPKKRREPQTRFSVCRKAVADFKKLKPSADALAELMVSYMEWATQFTYDYGDMWEQYYDSVESNFDKKRRHAVEDMERLLNSEHDYGVEDIYWELMGSGEPGESSQLLLVGMMVDRADVTVKDDHVKVVMYKKDLHK